MKAKWRAVLAGGAIAACILAGAGKTNVQAEVKNGAYLEDGGWNCYVDGEIRTDYNGWIEDAVTGSQYWFDDGVRAESKEIYDVSEDAWCWIETDGTKAVDKDVFIPYNVAADNTEAGGTVDNGGTDFGAVGKWVRYDENGKMIKGEDYRYGGWYYFDETTGAMNKGFVYLPGEDSEEDAGSTGKWVYYDETTGQMQKGESYLNGGWYRFDDITGKMQHGEYCTQDNWYYYDEITGIMQKGEICRNDNWYYYDEITGIMQKGEVYHHENWYYYDLITGIMQKGEVYHDDNWYYYDETTGVMQKGEVYHDDNWYYYDEITGTMQKGAVYHDGHWYYYDETTGVMRTGAVAHDGNTYYYNPHLGTRQYGLVYYDGRWHLFDDATGAEREYPNIVIVLDPGHDSRHTGAYENGMAEQELNFKIAQACKAELEQYKGVTVYMTHDTIECPFPGSTTKNDLIQRTDYAQSVGADLYLSLHNNAGKDLSGFEIYYPNDNYDDGEHEKGQAIAECIAEQLSGLGIDRLDVVSKNSDGDEDDDTNWYPDGSRADYYSVIRNSKYRGITGMIVEHAYLSNPYDAEAYLSSNEKLEALGIADATGVAAYYGLRKS